jgi:hypothetical protein
LFIRFTLPAIPVRPDPGPARGRASCGFDAIRIGGEGEINFLIDMLGNKILPRRMAWFL